MVIFKPFSGIRFTQTPTIGAQLAPPYDVISAEEQRILYNRHPHNIVRIDYGHPHPNTPPHDTVYTRAHTYLTEWLQSGVLQRDDTPAYYVYRHTYGLPDGTQKSLTGVMGALQLHPFEARQVIPHENTMPGPIQDRLSLTHHCQANLSPIYTLVDDPDTQLTSLLNQLTQPPPTMQAQIANESYELWAVTQMDQIQNLMGILAPRPVVIADGHHRYTTALHYQEWARQQSNTPDPESDYTLAFITTTQNPGITIYPTHRGVYDTNLLASANWLDTIQSVFKVESIDTAEQFLATPYPSGTIGMIRPESGPGRSPGHSRVWVLHAPDPEKVRHYFHPDTSLTLRQLDVALLQHVVLMGMLGMTLDSIAAKQGIRYYKAMGDLKTDLASGDIQAAFLMQPPPLSALTSICIQGEKMPQKSTYFYPKLITGLVINPVNPSQSSYPTLQETTHDHTN